MAEETSIPGYEIEAELGKGGTGTVYLATEQATSRKLALKVIPLDEDPTRRKRFELEARVGAMLDHPDIIDTYATGAVDGLGWIAMELLDGFELELAMRDDSFGFEDRLQVIMRVALALHYAHGKDLVHRDVKPSNIFLTRDGDLRLLDFGIARLKANKITKTGFIVGTPQFMAPEQISALDVDARADVFSLGVVAYELLAGVLPWSGENHTQIMMAVCSKPPRPLMSVFDGSRFDLDEDRVGQLSKIVHHAIKQEPEHRYPTAKAFAQALQSYLDGNIDDESLGIDTNVHVDPNDFLAQRIDWAVARAARMKVEEALPPPEKAHVDSTTREIGADEDDLVQQQSSNKLWFVLVAIFAIGLAGAIWMLAEQ